MIRTLLVGGHYHSLSFFWVAGMVKLSMRANFFKTYFYIYRDHMGQKYEPFMIIEDIRKIIVRHKCECLSCDVRSDIAQFHSQYIVTICLIYVA